jgi:16S rRNA processing protein RimM
MVRNHKEDKSALISLGVITKVRGTKGEVVVGLKSRYKKHFSSIKKGVISVSGGRDFDIEIENLWFHGEKLIAKFKGCDTIEQAEKMVENEVLISEKDLLPQGDNDFYIFQLIGLKVFIKGGEFLGEIRDILCTGGTDVLVVERSKKEYLIPMAEEYLENIDIDNKKIIIKPPEGLLEINEI